MQTITVELGQRSYPVYLGRNIAGNLPALLGETFPNSRFVLVTNATVLELYRAQISAWERSLQFPLHVLPDGERHKTVEAWARVLDTFVEARLERTSVALALGGGIVGDITGFAAAAFLRGIDFVQIPTTLLAMVDSSVGGKTGVNHPQGKNLIGAFHQPRLVWVDVAYLDTLPQRELIAGLAELCKCAFIGGPEMFEFVRASLPGLGESGSDRLLEGIRRAVRIKADIVAADERESGRRALLNFGHTFAHAIEQYYCYEGVVHGEAVLWGIRCSCDLGRRSATIPRNAWGSYDEILALLPHATLPSPPDPQRLYDGMFSDKKVRGGSLRFVVPAEVGASVIRDDIPKELVIDTLAAVFGGQG